MNFLVKPVQAVEIVVSKPANLQVTDLGKIIGGLIGVILIVAGLIAFLYLIQGGVAWITSGGDKAGVEAARNKIMAAVIGLVIVFATWAFMLILQKWLGITILGGTITLPSITGQ